MKKTIKLLALMVGLLLISGVIMMIVFQIGGQNSVEGLSTLSQFLEQQKIIFTAFRLSLVIIVFWKWALLGHWLARIRQWDDELLQLFLDIKWKVLIWILIFELVINQNLIGYLLN